MDVQAERLKRGSFEGFQISTAKLTLGLKIWKKGGKIGFFTVFAFICGVILPLFASVKRIIPRYFLMINLLKFAGRERMIFFFGV